MWNLLFVASLAVVLCPAPAVAAQQSRPAPRPGFDVLLQAAEKARDENRDEEAIAMFRRALGVKPESEEALWYLGSLLYEKEQYGEARDVLRQFLAARPDAGPAWAFLGLSEFELREYSRALDHLQRAMAAGMADRKELAQTVVYHVAILLTRFERYDESDDVLLKMLANDSRNPALIEPAGLAGLRLPLLPTEIPDQERALVDLAGQAVVSMQTQHNEEAESTFQRLVAAYPKEPGVHFLYGAYLTQLHPDRSVPEFEQELRISPSHVLARVRLAEQLAAQREFDRALALTREAIQLEPQRASAHMIAGEALLGKGESGEGIKELEAARAADARVSRIHWDLLRAYAAAGRKQDADVEKQKIEELLHSKSPSRFGDTGDARQDETAH